MKNGKLHVYVSAVRIPNEASRRVFCTKEPVKTVTLDLYNQYGEVELHFLGVSQTE